ncbi:MAG: hypothetical protein ABSG94_11010 [Brevinematales bacterium]
MDHTSIAKMYIDAIKNDSIDSSTLTKLPELVSCGDWSKVEVMGSVNFTSDRTKILYDGIIVTHGGGLYYMRKKISDALGSVDRRFKSARKVINVIHQ